MFTGLVEQQAKVIENTSLQIANRLILSSPFPHTQAGESISVNGVCLTLLPSEEELLAFDISPETCSLTTLGSLKKNDIVNLERAMLATARFGGHYVSGHVDTISSVQSVNILDEFVELVIGDFALTALGYLLPKGSIALDGVSLTINAVNKNTIRLMLVPHTLANTTLGNVKVGQQLNVEFDYFTRIIAHQLTISGHLQGEVEL